MELTPKNAVISHAHLDHAGVLDKLITLGKFTQKLLNEYGIKRRIYPQALITTEAIVKYFVKELQK